VEGLAELPLGTSNAARPDDVRIVARRGADVGVNALASYAFGASESPWTGFIYTDRPVYRPGHTVQFKGVFRAKTPDGYQVPAAKSVGLEMQDAAGATVYQKTLTMNANGTVRDQFVLPASAALGDYFIQVKGVEGYITGNFAVEEYKKPEYEVRVTPAQVRVIQGATNSLTIDANYYFGEPVVGAAVKYSVYRDRYWFPLWRDPEDEEQEGDGAFGGEGADSEQYGDEVSQGEGKLNEEGKLTIQVPSMIDGDAHDLRYRVEARVTDASRREITGSGSFVATYGSFVVNATTDRYFYAPGAKAVVTVEARNYESQPVRTPVQIELVRWNWRTQKEEQRSRVSAATGADGKGSVEVTIPREGGSYRIRVTARTPEGRAVADYNYFWASGASGDGLFDDPRRTVDVVPDKKTYRPGETARILIAAGAPKTAVLVTVEGRDLRSQRVLRAEDSTVVLDVPITLRDEPGFYVTAQFTRKGVLYRGSKYVRVPPEEHKLIIALTTDKPRYKPGDTALYNVEVRDVTGKPVPRAELSLGVVDEAIYAIHPDATPDPLRLFFGREYNAVNTDDSLTYYFSGEAGKRRMQLAQLRAPTKLAQLKPERLVLPKIRKAFPDTAFWAADVMTDAQGHAQAKVEFPDSLTTWRATARGVTADTKVGVAVAKNIVRKNFILRLSTPRFFTRGDEMTISSIVHNYLDTAKDAKVTLSATGLDFINAEPKTVNVPARGEVRVDWRVRAARVGMAKLTGSALTDEESDALELELPVHSPGVPLSISRGGSLPAGNSATLDLAFPERVETGSRRMAIRVSPSIAGALFGAVEYLTTFPYGCVEQTMSSFLPNVIVQQTVKELKLNVNLDQAQLREKLNDGLDRLYAFQHSDGGWGWWETDETHPFMTAYVVAGLEQARAAGVEVNGEVIERGAKWVETALKGSDLAPDLRAYLIFALSTRTEAVPMDRAYSERTRLSPYGLALLGLAMEQRKDARAETVAQALESAVKQDAEQAWWPAERDEMLDFTADVTPEATAYAVRFLSHLRPQSALLPKASVWLMNHRNEGYWWSSTKQTAMVIYGLTDYLKVTKELNPAFNATLAVNGKQVISRRFDSIGNVAEPDFVLTEAELQAAGNRVQVTTNGQGRLYYSVRAEYASSEEKLERTGTVSLNLLREYFRLVPTKTGDRIVYDTVPLDGAVASGDVVAVRLTVSADHWKYLLIEDPIPSGTEFIERDQAYELRSKPPWWQFYFTRREFHDNRMAIFERDFAQGQRDYFYLLKVVNPGKFHVSPARVQPMYQPGILATSASRELEVQ
jgi:alpha-2-macroglobulin